MKHNYGSIQLIRHRGPKRFTTDFERSLFVSQALNIVSFAGYPAFVSRLHQTDVFFFFHLQTMMAFMEGKRCYLGDDPWLRVLRSARSMAYPCPEGTGLATDYTEITINITNLMTDCTKLILQKKKRRSDDVQKRWLELLSECEAQHNTLVLYTRRWAHEFVKQTDARAKAREANKPVNGDLEKAIAWKLTLMMLCRLHVALAGDGTLAMEHKSQELAQEITDELDAPNSRITGPSTIVCRAFANAILDTAEEWLAFCHDHQLKRCATGDRRLIPPKVYLRWVKLNAIQISDDSMSEE